MANTVTTKKQVDGSRVGVYTIHLLGDGSGEESNTVVLDASALASGNYFHRIDKIEWSLTGFSASLRFDATTDIEIANLTEGRGCLHGPFTNPHGTGDTGDVLLSTLGLGSGDRGTIKIHAIKSGN